jgi:hypothetical protein
LLENATRKNNQNMTANCTMIRPKLAENSSAGQFALGIRIALGAICSRAVIALRFTHN